APPGGRWLRTRRPGRSSGRAWPTAAGGPPSVPPRGAPSPAGPPRATAAEHATSSLPPSVSVQSPQGGLRLLGQPCFRRTADKLLQCRGSAGRGGEERRPTGKVS